MMKRFTPIVIGLSILGMIALPTYAATATDSKKIATLEKQVAELQREMSKTKDPASTATSKNSHSKKTSIATASGSDPFAPNSSIAQGNSQIEGPSDLPTEGPLYLPVDFDVPGQSFVSSGPYIGIPLEFTGGHLIVNSPSVNEDVILLQVAKNINQRLSKMGRPAESIGSHVLLSGLVEGQALYRWGGGNANVSDIDLTSANFDAFILGPSNWTSGFLELAYDNNIGTQTGSFSSNNRSLNSRVAVSKAFIIIGDFMKSPFYASFGQMFVPFGVYSSTLVSSPLTKIMSRTLARPLVVGYQQQSKNALLATAYIFNGPSHASATNHVNNGGINLSYKFNTKYISGTFGGGVIANIADSVGMQFTGNNTGVPVLFGGFGGPIETISPDGLGGVVQQVSSGNEQLVHRVPAYDINAKLSMGNAQLIVEYITASTSFNRNDMTFNGDNAKPQALNIEGIYNLPWFINPTSITLNYQLSKDALAIGLPAKRYSLAVNRSFWKNTLQTLELRRDVNYAQSDTSTGSNVLGPNGSGKSTNQIVLQFDYYF